MILTVFMVSLRRLLHNRIELLLTFVVPIAFFSIFAVIFGGGVGVGSTPRIKVVAVDQVRSPASVAIVKALADSSGLRFLRSPDEMEENITESQPTEADDRAAGGTRTHARLTKEGAINLVRRGIAAIAIVLTQNPKHGTGGAISVELLSDTSDQVAPQVVSAFVQRAMLVTQRNVSPGAKVGPPPFGVELASVEVPNQSSSSAAEPTIQIVDVLGGGKTSPVISMYAAGIAVMFLLFGATGGGGVLLEERENQTLDRLLTTGLSMDQLLLGKWFYLSVLGVLQTTVMFVWGQIVFGIDLLRHLDGFLIMTLVTAGASAAFGLLLATICRTRGQLNGLSVVVVLSMSALGGSMVPRYVMSQSLRDAGLWTFNAWALDGYDKVFWREMPVIELWPQMSVLMISGAVFLVAARMIAIRWETE